MKIRQKHRELVAHYLRFAHDPRPATDDEIESFIQWESCGLQGSVDISRILMGKKLKELTLKMIYEEVFYFWGMCWGWAIPLLDVISDTAEDRLFRASCEKIFETLRRRGVANVLRSHSEFSDEQKQRWIAEREVRIGTAS